MKRILDASERLKKADITIALTGAGISVESGIPDFRSSTGLWAKYDPMEYGTIQAFRKDPGKVWKMLLEVDSLCARAQPNDAHRALAEMERLGSLQAVITQNVDSLHQRAGSRVVIEFHGNGRVLRCDVCAAKYNRKSVSFHTLPPSCACGGPLRPDFVFFGEGIPERVQSAALDWAARCDVMLVIGTSASVAPASMLPLIAKERGAFLIEVNLEPTPLTEEWTDLHLPMKAGRALPAILETLKDS